MSNPFTEVSGIDFHFPQFHHLPPERFSLSFHEFRKLPHCTVWKLLQFGPTNVCQKFRVSNVFSKEITKELISRNIFWWEWISHFSTLCVIKFLHYPTFSYGFDKILHNEFSHHYFHHTIPEFHQLPLLIHLCQVCPLPHRNQHVRAHVPLNTK